MRLIVNADDFGRCAEINRAVVRAHRQGVLSSASLMVAGAAADEAIELARQNPRLAVGLHVVAVDGPAVLPPDRIERLVDADGRFPDAPVRLGLQYAFNRRSRLELAAEITAQFERFAATGLPLSHVDSHQHMHMHPVVFDLVLQRARQFGAGGIRVVRDNLGLSLRCDRGPALSKLVSTMIFGLLARRCRRRCRGSGLTWAHRTYGFLHSGRMSRSYVLSVLQRMNDIDAEMYFHPTDGPRLGRLGPNPDELAVLLSAEVRDAIAARQLQLSRYIDLQTDDNRIRPRPQHEAPVSNVTRCLAAK